MLLDLLMKHQLVDGIVLSKIPQIERWNTERGTTTTFDKSLEISMLTEEYKECLEATDIVKKFDGLLDNGFVLGGTIIKYLNNLEAFEDDTEAFEFFDKYFGQFLDLFILTSKYMEDYYKDGFSPEKFPEVVIQGLQIVIDANFKKGSEKNAEGKIQKPADFVGPEAALKKLLDSSFKSEA